MKIPAQGPFCYADTHLSFIAYYALFLIVRVLTIPQYTFIDSINNRPCIMVTYPYIVIGGGGGGGGVRCSNELSFVKGKNLCSNMGV